MRDMCKRKEGEGLVEYLLRYLKEEPLIVSGGLLSLSGWAALGLSIYFSINTLTDFVKVLHNLDGHLDRLLIQQHDLEDSLRDLSKEVSHLKAND